MATLLLTLVMNMVSAPPPNENPYASQRLQKASELTRKGAQLEAVHPEAWVEESSTDPGFPIIATFKLGWEIKGHEGHEFLRVPARLFGVSVPYYDGRGGGRYHDKDQTDPRTDIRYWKFAPEDRSHGGPKTSPVKVQWQANPELWDAIVATSNAAQRMIHVLLLIVQPNGDTSHRKASIEVVVPGKIRWGWVSRLVSMEVGLDAIHTQTTRRWTWAWGTLPELLVTVNGKCLNEELVKAGFARAVDKRYVPLEKEAREAGKGMWGKDPEAITKNARDFLDAHQFDRPPPASAPALVPTPK
jgi:hypothetical protein